MKGSGWCELAGARHPIRAGEVLVIPPHAPHAYGADGKNPWTIYWFHAQGKLLVNFLAELNVSDRRPVVYLGDDAQIQLALEFGRRCRRSGTRRSGTGSSEARRIGAGRNWFWRRGTRR